MPEDDEGDSVISGGPPSVMEREEEEEEEVSLNDESEEEEEMFGCVLADVWLDGVSNIACSLLPCSRPSMLHIQVMLKCSLKAAEGPSEFTSAPNNAFSYPPQYECYLSPRAAYSLPDYGWRHHPHGDTMLWRRKARPAVDPFSQATCRGT
ncbi:hypothetical protein ARMGADRAFT_1091718 [Armillaria gallica]|uniref:Uncharacterized protein n=1 Tax=Armillaria gallica TaxID=47427 RepID=A0A2H3CHX9_ARMGA|nr:hypothetical protein ARMGADRAFT_1091718 [Armillaria gallica]